MRETAKAKATKRPPADSALCEQIEQVFRPDQEVREKNGFDLKKMKQGDREHAAVL